VTKEKKAQEKKEKQVAKVVVAARRKEKAVGSSKTANLDANFQNNMTHNAAVIGYPQG